jgi:hypothetical protein
VTADVPTRITLEIKESDVKALPAALRETTMPEPAPQRVRLKAAAIEDLIVIAGYNLTV